MGLRAYLMVDVADDVDQRQFVKALREWKSCRGSTLLIRSLGRTTW